ncbi:MAG TPA: hypothetical protein VM529_20620 [Gemmata sp.]|nr:hypothetical protein [Gemmata sp.]
MARFLAAAAFAALLAAGARADLIPPGTRNIAIDHTIETDKDYAGWKFFVVAGSGGVKEVKLDSKTPLTIPGSAAIGRGPVPRPGDKAKALQIPYRSNLLVAIPAETVKQFASEKELHAAVWDLKAEGMARAKDAFADGVNAKANDPRKSITRTFRVTKIDAKGGIVLEAVPAGGKPGGEEEAAAPPAYPWVAGGLAAAAAVGFAGLWLSRRTAR